MKAVRLSCFSRCFGSWCMLSVDVGGPCATATGTTADDESRFFFFSLIFHRSRLDLYVDLSLILISCLCVCVDLGRCWSMCEEGHNSLCIDALALTEDHPYPWTVYSTAVFRSFDSIFVVSLVIYSYALLLSLVQSFASFRAFQ